MRTRTEYQVRLQLVEVEVYEEDPLQIKSEELIEDCIVEQTSDPEAAEACFDELA